MVWGQNYFMFCKILVLFKKNPIKSPPLVHTCTVHATILYVDLNIFNIYVAIDYKHHIIVFKVNCETL